MPRQVGSEVGGVIPRRLAGQVPEADQDRLYGQSVKPRPPGTPELCGAYVGIGHELVESVRGSREQVVGVKASPVSHELRVVGGVHSTSCMAPWRSASGRSSRPRLPLRQPSLDPGDVVLARAGEVGGGIVQVVVGRRARPGCG